MFGFQLYSSTRVPIGGVVAVGWLTVRRRATSHHFNVSKAFLRVGVTLTWSGCSLAFSLVLLKVISYWCGSFLGDWWLDKHQPHPMTDVNVFTLWHAKLRTLETMHPRIYFVHPLATDTPKIDVHQTLSSLRSRIIRPPSGLWLRLSRAAVV